MIKFNDVTKENIKYHNPNRPQIHDHSYRILIINNWSFWIWKKNVLFNLISHQQYFEKSHLYAKDPYEENIYQLLINKWESAGVKYCKRF